MNFIYIRISKVFFPEIMLGVPLQTTDRELAPVSPVPVFLKTSLLAGRNVEEQDMDGGTIEKYSSSLYISRVDAYHVSDVLLFG